MRLRAGIVAKEQPEPPADPGAPPMAAGRFPLRGPSVSAELPAPAVLVPGRILRDDLQHPTRLEEAIAGQHDVRIGRESRAGSLRCARRDRVVELALRSWSIRQSWNSSVHPWRCIRGRRRRGRCPRPVPLPAPHVQACPAPDRQEAPEHAGRPSGRGSPASSIQERTDRRIFMLGVGAADDDLSVLVEFECHLGADIDPQRLTDRLGEGDLARDCRRSWWRLRGRST